MATTGTSTSADTSLRISRTYNAPREKVFAAWTEPQHLNRWFAPTDEFEVSADVDLRTGGKYRIEMKHSSGHVHTAIGEYREITPPERLIYTWGWLEDEIIRGTLVTIEFRDLGASTEVVLTHELFPDAEWRDKHNQGWTGCMARLDKVLAA
jgi:uncharacterized protein YndB with AHSA1/START domain